MSVRNGLFSSESVSEGHPARTTTTSSAIAGRSSWPKVDQKTLAVKRSTESIIVPERGARLGNFPVTEVSENETWVTVAEWMQTYSPNMILPIDNALGADNTVWAARILWKD